MTVGGQVRRIHTAIAAQFRKQRFEPDTGRRFRMQANDRCSLIEATARGVSRREVQLAVATVRIGAAGVNMCDDGLAGGLRTTTNLGHDGSEDSVVLRRGGDSSAQLENSAWKWVSG